MTSVKVWFSKTGVLQQDFNYGREIMEESLINTRCSVLLFHLNMIFFKVKLLIYRIYSSLL